MYGIGVAIGDYDNDGRDDVYITALEGDHLFHNEGDGHFRDVTSEGGHRNMPRSAPAPLGSTTTATANWICSSPTTCSGRRKSDLWCSLDGSTKSYCTPESYKGTSSQPVSTIWAAANSRMSRRRPGSPIRPARSLGVTVFDYNNDGWPDLFVANDTQPNKLYRNLQNGTFQGRRAHGGRGFRRRRRGARRHGRRTRPITTAPGGQHLIVGNFSNQMLGLYHNEGNGLFVDEAPRLRRRAAPAC